MALILGRASAVIEIVRSRKSAIALKRAFA
jgi:hypothetical protein